MKSQNKSFYKAFRGTFPLGITIMMLLISHLWADEYTFYRFNNPVMNQVEEDEYEDDNTYLSANVITADGPAQHHNFQPYSRNNSCTWIPSASGRYYLIVYVIDGWQATTFERIGVFIEVN